MNLQPQIEALLRDLSESPDEIRLLQKLGELYLKAGDLPRAAESLARAADGYARDARDAEGQARDLLFLRAVALRRHCLRLAPSIPVHEHLADDYEQIGLIAEALASWRLAAEQRRAEGDTERLALIIERLQRLERNHP